MLNDHLFMFCQSLPFAGLSLFDYCKFSTALQYGKSLKTNYWRQKQTRQYALIQFLMLLVQWVTTQKPGKCIISIAVGKTAQLNISNANLWFIYMDQVAHCVSTTLPFQTLPWIHVFSTTFTYVSFVQFWQQLLIETLLWRGFAFVIGRLGRYYIARSITSF